MDYFGINLDLEYNTIETPSARIISTERSKISLLVVPTDEEMQIAEQSLRMLQGIDTDH
jgi:acetate kinase